MFFVVKLNFCFNIMIFCNGTILGLTHVRYKIKDNECAIKFVL